MSKCRCDVDVSKVPDVVGVKCSFMLLYIIGHKGPQKVHIFIHLIRFTLERKLRNRSCITVTSWWARWRLKSPASQLFTTVYSGADQRKHQSSASLAFVRGIHRWPVIPAQRANNAENVLEAHIQKAILISDLWHFAKISIIQIWNIFCGKNR